MEVLSVDKSQQQKANQKKTNIINNEAKKGLFQKLLTVKLQEVSPSFKSENPDRKKSSESPQEYYTETDLADSLFEGFALRYRNLLTKLFALKQKA